MGGSSSKPPQTTAVAAPQFNLASVSTVGLETAQNVQAGLQSALEKTTEAVEYQSGWKTFFKWVSSIGGIIILGIGIVLLADWLWVRFKGTNFLSFLNPTPPAPPSAKSILYIDNATYSNDVDTKNVTAHLQSMISNDTTLAGFQVSYTAVGLNAALATSKTTPATPNTLVVSYHLCGDPPGTYSTSPVKDGDQFPTLPTSTDTCKAATGSGYKSVTPPAGATSLISRLTSGLTSGSSNLLGSIHDATTSTSVSGSDAPLSSEGDGAYGIQWWMFVKDWNYGYGKDKAIIVRPDPTNSQVMNPSVSLHPTDNSLRVSISVFPSTEGGAAASQPAPAGHSGSSDDVFICEVPNIPLQTWFSVGLTVFGRNMDIYIDGKLVKSCFMTGVPKPATGDIQITPNGGFSGNICNLAHYPRMLTPSDANSFWSAGTACQSATAPSSTAAATGYSVKFGVYDALGKQVQQYTF